MSDIGVSVLCMVYNHDLYLRDALDGFVMQKTNFKYEVIIHDDASTDNSAAIIREYAEKYPDIIKPIYEEENLYSKGASILDGIMIPKAKGKYLALCEGDDYWTDENKLQLQYDALEKHSGLDMCAHGAIQVDAKTNEVIKSLVVSQEETVLPFESVLYNGGNYFATATLMYRRCLNENTPEFKKKLPIDYTYQIHGAARGGVIWLPKTMAVYRYCSKGSWTVRNSTLDKVKATNEKVITMLQEFNEYYDYKYDGLIKKTIKKRKFDFAKDAGDYAFIKGDEYKELFSQLSAFERLKINFKFRFPKLTKIIRKILAK